LNCTWIFAKLVSFSAKTCNIFRAHTVLPLRYFIAIQKGVPMSPVPVPQKAILGPSDTEHLMLGYARGDHSIRVGIAVKDLRYILHITGAEGSGKTALLKRIASQLIEQGKGFLSVDHHRPELTQEALRLIPLEREQDMLLFELKGMTITDDALPPPKNYLVVALKAAEDLRPTLNILSQSFVERSGLDHSGLAGVAVKMLAVLDPKIETQNEVKELVYLAVRALLEGEKDRTFLHLVHFLRDEHYRAAVCARLSDPQLQRFWMTEYEIQSASNKLALSAFADRLAVRLATPDLSALLIAPDCSLDLHRAMDGNGIVLADLSGLDTELAQQVSALLMLCLSEAAFSRHNRPIEQRPHWPVLIDDAETLLAQSALATILCSRLRAFHIGMVVAHQSLEQLGEAKGIIMGNAQSRVILPSSPTDAHRYGKMYEPLGYTTSDFAFGHMMQLYGCGPLFPFSVSPGSQIIHSNTDQLVQNQAIMDVLSRATTNQVILSSVDGYPKPEPIDINWRTISAPAVTDLEHHLDDLVTRIRDLDPINAYTALLGLSDDDFAGYCARTKAHRLAQRQFILENPGCIPDRTERIRTLSALRSYAPRIESAVYAQRIDNAQRLRKQA
jgi:energy-coupling factor transporter ATP-binding protein EcfA2